MTAHTVHLLTIHAPAGGEAAKLALAGVAAILRDHKVAWWVPGPSEDDREGGIKVMAKVPDDLEIDYSTLLASYSKS